MRRAFLRGESFVVMAVKFSGGCGTRRPRQALADVLLGAVGREPVGEQVEIDLVAVEFGALDAGEFRFAAHLHPATAAHAGAIDHHRVERDDGVHAERAREISDGPHHRHRAYGVNDVDAAGGEDFLRRVGDKAFSAVAAVIGADGHVAEELEFVFKNHPFLRAAADHAGDMNAAVVQTLGNRMHDGGAHAAPDAQRAAFFNHFRRHAERAGNILDGLADFERDQFFGALAGGLDHQGDGAEQPDWHRRW